MRPVKPFVLPAMVAVMALAVACALPGIMNLGDSGPHARKTISFDPDWRFMQGDAAGAEAPAFNDAAWSKIDVPHDWAIAGPYDQNAPSGGSGGYLPSGISWYRKSFTLPESDAGKHVFIDFEGVMGYGEVWINGVHLGKRPNGYVSYEFELTGHLNFGEGKPNILAVKTDTTRQPESRWYPGEGIYRHVRLVVADPVHVANWGVYVTTPNVSAAQATVMVSTSIVNQSAQPSEVVVETTLLGPGGSAAGTGVSAPVKLAVGAGTTVTQEIAVANPQLWDIDAPNLYKAATKVLANGKLADDSTTPFGIRTIEFKPETGFWLNGKNMKLKGVCLHGDGGAVGVAVPASIWEYRIKTLKSVGVNAIRCAHNPPDPDFLDVCDRMGVLVMDELFDAWTVGKPGAEQGLNVFFLDTYKSDAYDTILRDRNHPSIVLYSAGNEIHDTPRPEIAIPILRNIVNIIHAADPTRPVTQALFRPNVSHDYDDGLADLLDVIGTNYRNSELLAAQKAKPTRKIVNTEEQHSLQVWASVRDNAPLSGDFLWSGIDYLGEARWPAVSSSSGVLDRTGAERPRTWERQSWWSEKPMVHIVRSEAAPAGARGGRGGGGQVSDWTPAVAPDGPVNVTVFSNCDTVELQLNGKSLGEKPRSTTGDPDSARSWSVPYAAGTITAIGKNGGKEVARHELKTAGKPAKLVLTSSLEKIPDSFEGAAVVTATVTDEAGVRIPAAADLIKFKVDGPGKVVAVDNGDPTSHESMAATQYKALNGDCIAIVKATASSGPIKVTASADGLADGSIELEAVAP